MPKLKNREVDYALAGGVNVLLMPESNVTLCKAKALSPDGECKTLMNMQTVMLAQKGVVCFS